MSKIIIGIIFLLCFFIIGAIFFFNTMLDDLWSENKSAAKIKIPGYICTYNDKSSVMEEIYGYIKKYHGLAGTKKHDKEKQDLVLEYELKYKKFPKQKFVIETKTFQAPNSKEVRQIIQITTSYKLPEALTTGKGRNRLLKFNTELMFASFPSEAIILDKQLLVLKSSVEIPKEPISVPVEMVFYNLMQMYRHWPVYYYLYQDKFQSIPKILKMSKNKVNI